MWEYTNQLISHNKLDSDITAMGQDGWTYVDRQPQRWCDSTYSDVVLWSVLFRRPKLATAPIVVKDASVKPISQALDDYVRLTAQDRQAGY